jgi:alpha-D-xyloside xylohydrolase
MQVSIPWYVSSLGYGFLWNSAAHGYVNLTTESLTWFANVTMGADIWVTTYGSDWAPGTGQSFYAQLMSHYVDAVGHASTMPYYSTGFIQCKDR